MSKPTHVGPTLFWAMREPRIGETFRTFNGDHEVISVEAYDGGYLFTTKIVAVHRTPAKREEA